MLQKWRMWREQAKALVQRYGWVAVGVHLSIYLSVLLGSYLLLNLGFAVEGQAMAATMDNPRLAEWGLWGVAFALTKLVEPVRLLATFAATPWVARRLEGRKARPAN